MGELRTATAGMTAEQKSNLANTIAGTQAQKGLLAILNASEEDYNKLADAINNADGAAANMSETMMDNLPGKLWPRAAQPCRAEAGAGPAAVLRDDDAAGPKEPQRAHHAYREKAENGGVYPRCISGKCNESEKIFR